MTDDDNLRGFTSVEEEVQRLRAEVDRRRLAGGRGRPGRRTPGDSAAATLRRIWDNMWVFWLGSVVGAVDAKRLENGSIGRSLVVFGAGVAVLILAAWFVWAQERRAARR